MSELELRDTAVGMTSDDWKERFKSEYLQTKIRYQKLQKICVKYIAGTLDFDLKCPIHLLEEQKLYMGRYLNSLEIRAELEGIDLEEV